MSGSSQYPSHQHNVNSHDRIFGSFEAACPAPLGTAASEESKGPRRRRWVRTRTQHLSSLSLEDDDHAESSSSVASTPGDGALLPPSVPVESPASVGGRYPFRRPDGNPVTGEGYGRVDSHDLQATVPTKKTTSH